MQDKLVVQFKHLPVYYHKTDYIVYCKHCNSYTINNQAPCYKCGASDQLITLDTVTQKIVKRDFYIRNCFILMVYTLLFLLSMNFTQLVTVTAYTLLCLLLNLLFYTTFKHALCLSELDKYIHLNHKKIKQDLTELLNKIQEKTEEKKYLEAYEDLRYLGMLIDTEEVRFKKINCLRHFRLRADLPLELKEILLIRGNKYLIEYIYEVSKIKKELIDEDTIQYILGYKEQILGLPEGEKIIAKVVEAALKSKYLTRRYAYVMYDYLDYFSKERLIRLWKIKECITDRMLVQQIADKIKLKYGQDEAFSNSL